jgi:biopolymer transport protein TolQ
MTFFQGAPTSASPDDAPTIKLDLVGLIGHAAWPVKITVALLVVCSLLVWVIAVLKLMQLGRLRASEGDFERRARKAGSAKELYEIAGSRVAAPGARVVGELYKRGAGAPVDRLRAVADRAIVTEGQSARALMWFLAFIASAAPFIGLFASLPVVAPAIGEALITTAIGLAAAIPAVFFYNWIDKRVGDFVSELEASAAEWVAILSDGEAPHVDSAIPLVGGRR